MMEENNTTHAPEVKKPETNCRALPRAYICVSYRGNPLGGGISESKAISVVISAFEFFLPKPLTP